MRFLCVTVHGLFLTVIISIGLFGCECDAGFHLYSGGVLDTEMDGGIDSDTISDSDIENGDTTGDFSVVMLPDTQYYTTNGSWMTHFYDQTDWVMQNRLKHNIKAVIHVGDIVEHDGMVTQELIWADQAMKTLDEPFDGYPDGMPYGIVIGNHDATEFPYGEDDSSGFNEWFGLQRFQNRSYFGDNYGEDIDVSYWYFSGGGVDFLVLQFEWWEGGQTKDVLDWGLDVVRAHPDHFVIINQHYVIDADGWMWQQGDSTYQRFKAEPNVHLMLCGHVGGVAHSSRTYKGHTIHSFLADYQFLPSGGQGWMQLLEFAPDDDSVRIKTVNATTGEFDNEPSSNFVLPIAF